MEKECLPDDCPPEKSYHHEECEEEESSESEQSLTNSDDESKMSTYTWRDNGSINRKHSIWFPRSVRAIIVGKS